MTQAIVNSMLNILLADDDVDERYFFEVALNELPIKRNLTTVSDGAQLMEHLSQNSDSLPDVLFLDIMMPRKNGVECLEEIMSNERLKQMPIVMYSTSLGKYIHTCYQLGASYFLQKGLYSELAESIGKLLAILGRINEHISEDKFKFSLQEAY